AQVHTDATDSVAEEDATCYLQIVLAGQLPDVGSERLMQDMDAWGYTYRLGSTRAWVEQDAEDARAWLSERGLLPATSPRSPDEAEGRIRGTLRGRAYHRVPASPLHSLKRLPWEDPGCAPLTRATRRAG